MSKFDQEYYIMNIDGANNHPLLNWGSTRKAPFLKPEPMNIDELDTPLKIIFAQPYPNSYEIPDLLMLTAQFAGSKKLKTIFEELNVYGVQFVPIEIESNKAKLLKETMQSIFGTEYVPLIKTITTERNRIDLEILLY